MLLLKIDNEENEIQKAGQLFHLKDLFDITIGVIPDRKKFHNRTEDSAEEVYLLNLGSALDDNSKKTFLNINRFEDLNRLNFNEVIKTSFKQEDTPETKKAFIPQSKIIGPFDYLISIRGRPKGFSMLKSVNQNEIKVAVTNHFIKLTPRLPYQNMFIPYLHLLLDLIVEKQVGETFEEKKITEEKNKKKYNTFNSFKIQDFRETKIKILTDKSSQEIIYNNFISKYNDLLNASLVLDRYRIEIYETITAD